MNILYCYTDGGCSNNFDVYENRSMVWVVADAMGDKILKESTPHKSGGSNNIAELYAIRDAMRYAKSLKKEVILIKTDSRVAKNWIDAHMLGFAKLGKHINNPELTLSILEEIKAISKEVELFIKWIPREENLAGHIIENEDGL